MSAFIKLIYSEVTFVIRIKSTKLITVMFSYLWGGKKKETDKPENECAELAMRDALDAYGEFQTKIDGTLEYKDFIVFRAIIMRQSSRHFEPKRDELNEKKLEAFANKDQ